MTTNLNRQSILISNVNIPPRMRKDLGDIDSLAESIRQHSLIQPIVLSPDHILVAGERRLRAHQHLGLQRIDFVYVQEMQQDEREELEFEENYWRKAMTWQEECLGILGIYQKKKMRGALEGWSWGNREAAHMFNMALGTVNYVIAVAQRLKRELSLPVEQRKYHNYSSPAEAYRLGILGEEEARLAAELALRAKAAIIDSPQAFVVKGVSRYVPELPPLDQRVICVVCNGTKNNCEHCRDTGISWSPTSDHASQIFMQPLEEGTEIVSKVTKEELLSLQVIPLNIVEEMLSEEKRTIYLSKSVIQVDCITFMNDPSNAGRFDHIITDPPYGIDMGMLDQTRGAMIDLDKVKAEHDVLENEQLLCNFFAAAFKCTKEKAFVLTCCDIMQWQLMYDAATSAGFAVQRWPFIWKKVNQGVGNSMAMYNTTKDFEIVMLCRKPTTTFINKLSSSFIEAGNTEVTRLTGHPFAKPFELTRLLCNAVSMEGQTILEPFAGRGSMAIEMLKMKRNVVALEKQTEHFNALLENVKTQYYLKLNPQFIFK